MLKSELFKKLEVSESRRELYNYFIRALFTVGLGKITKQEFELDAQYIDKATTLWELFAYFESISAKNWLNYSHSQHWMISFLKDKDPTVQPFALFCPSYIKDGTPGLNDQIGNTTKIGVKNFISFLKEIKFILGDSIKIVPVVHLGTLALEQYSGKEADYWLRAIENNRKLIEKEFKDNGYPLEVLATHCIETQKETISFKGKIDSELIDKHRSRVKPIFDRNKRFYVDTLGWSEEESDIRTGCSITTYTQLGYYYSQNLEHPIFLYTANSYEKAIAYNLENQNLLIIYPRKDELQNMMDIDSLYRGIKETS